MSLATLREARVNRSKPFGIVKVVVGHRVPAVEDRPDVVTVAPGDTPSLMDWRPVIGLPLALFVCDDQSDLGERVYDAAKAAGAKLLGVAWSDAVVGGSEAEQAVLHRMWEQLCLS